MRKQIWSKGISLMLAGALLCVSFAGCQKKAATDNPILAQELNGAEYTQQAYTTMAQNAKKEETIYINTTSDGTVYKVYVTDWLHTDTPQVRIADVSNLSDIQNVKTLTEPVRENDTLYWDMDTTDLYYSGITEQQPPVTFTIKYFLEGQEMSAEDIAGRKGNVAIQITVHNSLKKEITVSGKTYTVTCPMLVAGGTILPEETFTNIAVDYGTTMSDGAKQIVFFTGIPGMDESLGLSDLDISLLDKAMYTDTYTVTAYTECFSLGNLMFAALPLSSVGTLGNGGTVDSIDSLKEVLSDVEKIQTALNGLDMQKTIDLLYGDTNKIESLMRVVAEATKLYSENEKMLKVLGGYMTEENMAKLDKLVKDLNNTDLDAIAQTLSDPKMKQLLQLLPKLSESLADMAVLAEDLNDVMPIYESLAKDMEDPEIQKSIENLPQTLEKLNEMVAVLEENRALLEQLGALASEDKSAQVEVLVNTAEKYAGASALSEAQSKALAARVEAWINYGNEYTIFTRKTEQMTSSVLFTYKTDAVKQSETAANASAVPTETEENKFVAWVKGLFA